MPLSPVKSRHEGNWLHFNIPSGGEWNPVSWIPLWKVTIFPVRRWRTSVHQEEAESIQAQRI